MKDGRDIEDRTFRFAVRVVRLVNTLSEFGCSGVLARQLVRSGTSVGANVEEAQGAGTRKEFARKINIARSEALYWLRLLAEAEIVKPARLEAITQEANELVSILTAIVKKAREKKVTGDPPAQSK